MRPQRRGFDSRSTASRGRPWTKYQTAQPSQPAPVTRDPWERPENENAPWLDYQAAKPETTVGAFIDPYANNSLADDARLVGGLADKAVRNVVNGATLGYGDKIAAGLDALTRRSPDYATALADERGRSAQAMAQPGGLGTAEQIAGMALARPHRKLRGWLARSCPATRPMSRAADSASRSADRSAWDSAR
jgi:hypothetical protein